MPDNSDFQYGVHLASQDFYRARRKADLERIWATVTGESVDLLSFDEVAKTLKITGGVSRGLRTVPINSIIGSVNRYRDFTKTFLPRLDSDEHRWVRVQAIASGAVGFPPIEVYKIDQAYFVIDGNHRVSIARQFGAQTIEAYVTELRTKIPLSPDVKTEDLIIKAEYQEFLETTRLDELRPQTSLILTAPGKYRILQEQIARHCKRLEKKALGEMSLADKVANWHDQVYVPVATTIEQRGVLRDFPNRTVTDLYVWAIEYRLAIQEQLGWTIRQDTAIGELIGEVAPKDFALTRFGRKVYNALLPNQFGSGPKVGKWRKEVLALRSDNHIITNILVPISGTAAGWSALEQALRITDGQHRYLHGLHVVKSAKLLESEQAKSICNEFQSRCQAAGIKGKCLVESGNVARKICELARWTDLVVLHLLTPSGDQPLRRFKSPFRLVVQGSPRPILAVPQEAASLGTILLCYDGSPKSKEALYLSAYLVKCFHSLLTVLCVRENGINQSTALEAHHHLKEHGINANIVLKKGKAEKIILETSQKLSSDLIVMGGYGHTPILEAFLGSTVDVVLRHSKQPTLICR